MQDKLCKSCLARGLKYFRQLRNLTQEEVCTPSFSVQVLKKAETAKTFPSIESMSYLAQKLQVNIDDLIYFDSYLLLQSFDSQKQTLLHAIDFDDYQQINSIYHLTIQLLQSRLAFTRKLEIQVYAFTAEFWLITHNFLDNTNFHESFNIFIVSYTLNSMLSAHDILLLTLLFRQHPQPLDTDLYAQYQEHSQYLHIDTLVYTENFYLLTHQKWQLTINQSTPFLSRANNQCSILTLATINKQVSWSYEKLHNYKQASFYNQRVEQLLSHYPHLNIHQKLDNYNYQIFNNTIVVSSR
ncbi:MAG: helix-turn-helix domain-containing protein [Culicoidibacterales bacterium]